MNPYEAELEELTAQDRFRYCRTVEPATNWPQVRVDGQLAVDFCSNHYLGLAQDKRLKTAAYEAIQRYGTGSGSSRLVSGTSLPIKQLEESVARFKGTESARIFNSGYQANVGVIQALLGKGDYVFMDRLNHASLVDGCLLSGARLVRYAHLDMTNLESRLRKVPADQRKWIISDTVFSMDGDSLKGQLGHLLDLAEQYNALVMLDEAHATGLWGDKRSSGLVEAEGETERVTLHMGTFSKALGGFGAYVAGSQALMEVLTNRSRGFIYSTALPPAVVATAEAALTIVQSDSRLKECLWDNVRYFKSCLAPILEGQPESHSQIIPIILGQQTMPVCEALLQQGFFVQGIRPPTVPEGSERLRISISAVHSREQLDAFASALSKTVLNWVDLNVLTR